MIQYVHALRRLGWLVVALPLLGLLVALGVSRFLTPTYEAQATLLIKPVAPLSFDGADAKSLTNAEILETNAFLMTQSALLRQVSGELSQKRSASDLAQEVEVKAQPSTTALIVTVRDRNPMLARDIANRLVIDYLDQSKHVRQQQIDEYVSRLQGHLAATQKLVSDEQLRLSALQAIAFPTSDQLGQRAALQQQVQADQAHYSDLVQALANAEAQSARGTDSGIFASPANVPTDQISPSLRQNVAIGMFGGVLIALLAILLLAPASSQHQSMSIRDQLDEDGDGKTEPEWSGSVPRHRHGERTARLPARRRSGRGQTVSTHRDGSET